MHKVDELHHREDDDDLQHDERHLWAVTGAWMLALATCILTASHPVRERYILQVLEYY